jgi:hypothetical protein
MGKKNVRIKKLKWGGNMASNEVCSYYIEYKDEDMYGCGSHTFRWYPDTMVKGRRQAMQVCQRHYESIIRDLLEDDEDE